MLSEKNRKKIASLDRAKGRERLDAFLIEGVRSVDAAITAGADLHFVVTTRKEAFSDLRRRAEALGAESAVVSEREIARLSNVETCQGVLAVAARQWQPDAIARTVLVLDGVQDPGNVGTLLRTAAWFGVEAAVCAPGTADFYHPKVVRSSMGAIWDLRLFRTKDLGAFLDEWRSGNRAVYAADLGGGDIGAWTPVFPSALLVGSEAHGISSEIADRIDERVHIPAGGRARSTESLNAAVAGGLVMWSWSKSEGTGTG